MEALFDLMKDQPLAIITFGVVLALIVGVRYLGLWQGQNAPPSTAAGSAQVAAVIVDPSALNRLTAAGEALNITLTERNMIAKRAAEVHADDVKVTSELRDEMDRIREEMRIQREINRK